MGDTLLGVVVLAIFLVFVFAFGYVLYRFKNARLASYWQPLIGLVNGKVTGDGGGGATSWLVGTYQSRPMQASIVPDQNMYSTESSGRYNFFSVALTGVPGRHNWQVSYHSKVLGLGQEGWQVKADDPVVASSVLAANIVALVEPFGMPAQHLHGQPILAYSRHTNQLSYQADITPRQTPTPQQFTQLLDTLLHAEAINARVNPTSA